MQRVRAMRSEFFRADRHKTTGKTWLCAQYQQRQKKQ